MVFRPSRLVLPLLLPTLLLCESCRSHRQLLVDSLSEVSTSVQQRTELESSLLRSLSSFLSVDVIDSLFLLASPVQPASGVLAPDSAAAAASPRLLPAAVRHLGIRACLDETGSARSEVKTTGSTDSLSAAHGHYRHVVPPSRNSHPSLLFLLLVINVVALLYLKHHHK